MGALMMIPVLFLTACGGGGAGRAEELAGQVRTAYIGLETCQGRLELTADYGERTFSYGVDLTWEREGETVLTITSPEEVAGTTARIARRETALEFDGVLVETGPLDESGLSPIDVVPALLSYAREGFIAESVLEDWEGTQRLHLTFREPEEDPGTGREAQLWFDPDTFALLRGELSQAGRTVIQCEVTGFQMETGPAA